MNDQELIQTINTAAYEVRRHLTPGYLESVYGKALVYELKSRGLNAEIEVPLQVLYKGCVVGEFRADIVVEGRVIIELKSVKEINPAHEAQLVNYLTATGIDYGILINYGGEKFAFRVKNRIYNRS